MNDETESEETMEETHELEDSEQDELEEDDDIYDEDETDQSAQYKNDIVSIKGFMLTATIGEAIRYQSQRESIKHVICDAAYRSDMLRMMK